MLDLTPKADSHLLYFVFQRVVGSSVAPAEHRVDRGVHDLRYSVLICICAFLVLATAVASPNGDVGHKMHASSDNWGMYFSNMAGHSALTVFDDGISETIDGIDLPNSIKVKLYLNETRADGLPTTNEGERLMQIGPVVENAISDNGGLFLGRVTTNKVRWNIGFAPADVSKIERALQQGSEAFRFRYELYVESDPTKTAYWQDLYPTDDDRQVMADMEVTQALSERGDDQYAERPVEHWAYFESKAEARTFANWGVENGYKDVEVFQQKDGLLVRSKWLVRFKHHGTMVLNDISHHSIKLSRQAREHGGVYDGWETPVTK